MNDRYLTFDCYGTLVDWKSGIEGELRSLMGELPLSGKELLGAYVRAEQKEELSYKKYRVVLRDTALALSLHLGRRLDAGSAEAFASSVPNWPIFPDTKKFLREMGRRGYRRYILSNVDNDLLEGTIEKNGLEVDGFVTAEDVGSYKPAPAHWQELLRRTQASRESVLHVAQSIFHDIVPAQNLGISSAWVNRYAEPLPPGASPIIISDTLDGLAKTID